MRTFFLFFFIGLNSLSAKQLWIQGEIKEAENLLFDSFVKIYQSDVLLDEKRCDQGLFNFPLDFEAIYTLEFGKNGYVSKKIEISTLGLPKHQKEQKHHFSTIIFLFEPREEMDLSCLIQPIGKVYYKPLTGFINDEEYAREIQPKLWLLHKISESYASEANSDRQYWEEYEYSDLGKKSLLKVLYSDQEKIVYKKVIHTWGGVFYFKNDQTISQAIFELETDKETTPK